MVYGLSKSRLMSFRQCPKRLWLDVHRPELAVKDPQTEANLAVGHEVGEIARRLYDDGRGTLIDYHPTMAVSLARTQEILAQASTSPIFEATFERNGLLIRADVLLRGENGARLVEVKASTKIKPEYFDDCAIQTWVLGGQALKLQSVSLAHINNEFVYRAIGNHEGFLVEEDLTAAIGERLKDIEPSLEQARITLESGEPESPIGSRCAKPYECPYRRYCWQKTDYPLTGLPAIGRQLDELIAQGYHDVRDLKEDQLRGVEQRRVWRAVARGAPERLPGARAVLAELPYPRYYLDFETIGHAIPRWLGTRPYQSIPFQWSVHFEQRDGSLDHRQFLDLSGELPVRAAAETLIEAVGATGPILMFTDFERRCITTLMAFCPDLAVSLQGILDRLVDLHPVAKRHYYHPAMQGSWSIKAIIPTIARELDYAALGGVADGMDAQRAYVVATSPETPASRREDIRRELFRYCRQDTLAMVKLAQFLETEAKPQ